MPTKYDCGGFLPSDNYIDLTLGASGTTYTAPANGYFVLAANAPNTADHDGIYIYNTVTQIGITTTQIWGRAMRAFVPVLKEQIIIVNYSSALTDKHFRFIYIEGQPSIIKY